MKGKWNIVALILANGNIILEIEGRGKKGECRAQEKVNTKSGRKPFFRIGRFHFSNKLHSSALQPWLYSILSPTDASASDHVDSSYLCFSTAPVKWVNWAPKQDFFLLFQENQPNTWDVMSRSRATNVFGYGKFIGLFYEKWKYTWFGNCCYLEIKLSIYIIWQSNQLQMPCNLFFPVQNINLVTVKFVL